MDSFGSVLGLLATAIAAVGAVGSGWSARHSSAAARMVARIEQDRRHVELTPQFEVNCRVVYGDRAVLRLTLTGPPGLDHLDSVIIAIRDDRHDREPIVAGAGKPVRLKVTSHREGYKPWVIPLEIEVEQGDGTR